MERVSWSKFRDIHWDSWALHHNNRHAIYNCRQTKDPELVGDNLYQIDGGLITKCKQRPFQSHIGFLNAFIHWVKTPKGCINFEDSDFQTIKVECGKPHKNLDRSIYGLIHNQKLRHIEKSFKNKNQTKLS